MIRFIRLCCTLLYVTISLTATSQESTDILLKKLQNVTNKEEKAKIMTNLSIAYLKSNPKQAVNYAEQALEITKKSDKEQKTKLYNTLGAAYYYQKNFRKSISNYEKELEIIESTGNKDGIMRALYNTGTITKELGRERKAIDFYEKSLVIAKEIGNREVAMRTFEALAEANKNMKKYKEAYDCYHEFIKLRDEKLQIKTSKQITILEEKYEVIKEEKIRKEQELIVKDSTLSVVTEEKTNLEKDTTRKAKELQVKNETIKEKDETVRAQRRFIAIVVCFLVAVFTLSLLLFNMYRQKRKANEKLAIQNAQILEQKEEILAQSEQLEEVNIELEKLSIVASRTDNAVIIMDGQGNFEWVNEGFTRLFGFSIDQLTNEQSINIIGKNTAPETIEVIQKCLKTSEPVIYEYFAPVRNAGNIWVQVTLTPILNENNEIDKLVAIDTDIRKIKEAEEKITAQRDKIQKQNVQITDSIQYASRIQSAILPPAEFINKVLPKHFVLFKPRDIVSGDFYWLSKQNERIFVAAADCTGHGVPGAFMSMLGITLLNEIVNCENIIASEILNRLRNEVKKSLRQTGKTGEAKDGMDIALSIIDTKNNRIQFSGANNSLYLIRNKQLTQFKGDRMPIGIYVREKTSFTNHEIEIQKGDCIYMFSDGYVDQFGGSKGNKFLIKKFKQMLIDINHLAMSQQKEFLDKAIEDWKSDKYEQVDDILVMGINF